jgi:DNA-binding response OmpR family regulator
MNSNKNIGKILIVDDTPYNLKVLSNLLLQKGHEVRQALNGEIALKAVETDPPDVILLDILMPDMDGYQVCERLKYCEKTANIPVIFLTALDDLECKVKAWSFGGVDYITKPFHFSEVLVRIENQISISLLPKKLQIKNQQLKAEKDNLEQINARLLKENRELLSWIDRICYRIKLPLQSILTNLNRLFERYQSQIDSEHKLYFQQTIDATISSQYLMNSLSDYVRAIAPPIPSELQPIDCEIILAEVLKKLAPDIENTGANITYTNLPNIMAEPQKIKQLFENLLGYLLNFGSSESARKIELWAEYRKFTSDVNPLSGYEKNPEADLVNKSPKIDGEWLLTIHDNDMVIPPPDYETIFDILQEVYESPEDRLNGMNLVICRKIVESYGGCLWIESTSGLGKLFRFTIPGNSCQ